MGGADHQRLQCDNVPWSLLSWLLASSSGVLCCSKVARRLWSALCAVVFLAVYVTVHSNELFVNKINKSRRLAAPSLECCKTSNQGPAVLCTIWLVEHHTPPLTMFSLSALFVVVHVHAASATASSVAVAVAPMGKTVQIAPGVVMPSVSLGTCCGSDPK